MLHVINKDYSVNDKNIVYDTVTKYHVAVNRDKHVVIIIMILLLILCIRVLYLDTIAQEFLSQQLNQRVLRMLDIVAQRGNITDRNLNPLAISSPVESVWIDPAVFTDLSSAKLKQLASLLYLNPRDILNKIQDKTKTFVYLRRFISPQQAQAVLALSIAGVYTQQEFKRFYPNSNLAAQVVGFDDIDNHGVSGIEYAYNKYLSGKNGIRKVLRDLHGNIVAEVGKNTPAIDGRTLVLALDNRIQAIAYNALQHQMQLTGAKNASAIVLDANTGEILAMTNMPSFDPNHYKNNHFTTQNRATTNTFDPGSIIKPFIIAKALDDKFVTKDTIIDTNFLQIGKKIILDDHHYNHLSVAQVIEHSSDIGTAKIALKFYHPYQLWQYYRKLGFGHMLGTGFPGETNGLLLDWHRWHPLDQAVMSYGYGISVSLLQMVHAYTLFTNHGCLLPISFNKLNFSPNHCQQLIQPTTAKIMRNILAQSTEDGTGKPAKTADYIVAGKTGTAQILLGKHYTNLSHIASFIGFAPANKPRIIVAVMLEQPAQGNYHGSAVAAPVFAQIVQPTLHLLGVAADK